MYQFFAIFEDIHLYKKLKKSTDSDKNVKSQANR